MPPLYVTVQGATLRYRTRRLIVEKDGEEVTAVPAAHVDQVLILGNVTVTTPALSFLLEAGVDTVFLTLQGQYKGRLVGPVGGNAQLRLFQYRRVSDPAWALETARAVVVAKLHNMRTLLRRYARREKPPPSASPEGDGDGVGADPSPLSEAADRLDELIARAGRCATVNSLSGVEGQGTAVYFSVFRHLIREPGWSFEKRTRRPPRDPVNALLSFGYTLLAHQVESAVRATGLDPYLGFLHQVAYNRPSLALDLVEEFRPIVVDSVVLRCLNNRIVLPVHFIVNPEGTYPVLLSDEGRARFIREFEARLNLSFRHPDSQERVTYRRCFELQARRMARAVQTGEVYRPFQVR